MAELIPGTNYERVYVNGAWIITQTGSQADTDTLEFGPEFVTGGGTTIAIPTGAIVATGYVPVVDVPAVPVDITIPTGAIVATGYVPVVIADNSIVVQIPVGAIVATGYSPIVSMTGHVLIDIPAGGITAAGYEPTVEATEDIDVAIPTASITATGYVLTVFNGAVAPIVITPDVGSLTFEGYNPAIDIQACPPATCCSGSNGWVCAALPTEDITVGNITLDTPILDDTVQFNLTWSGGETGGTVYFYIRETAATSVCDTKDVLVSDGAVDLGNGMVDGAVYSVMYRVLTADNRCSAWGYVRVLFSGSTVSLIIDSTDAMVDLDGSFIIDG